jgi:RNA polymerase sigma-70 factor, ECF subfamily
LGKLRQDRDKTELINRNVMAFDSGDGKINCHPLATDTELFLALKARQHAALEILYDRYVGLVYRLAQRILNNTQEAEDLTQEIFLNFWRNPTYNPDRGSLSTFLTTITRSRGIDRLRSRGSKNRFLQRWSQVMTNESSSLTPFETASLLQRSEYLIDALAKLPDRQRQVLELAYYDGLSQSEIATRLNIPLGTVKTWSRQGLLNLRNNLQALLE